MKFWALALSLILISAPPFSIGAEPSPLDMLLQRPSFLEKLTQQTVVQTFQDSRGALWLITEEGLNKYTGHELENYRHTLSNPESLPANTVTRVAEDHQGDIWVSTLGGGLARYDLISNSFRRFPANPNNTNTPYSNDIYSIYTDSKGFLWLGYSNGFSVFDPMSFKFHHYISGNDGIPFMGEINDFTETSNGLVWAATQYSGLLEINRGLGQVFPHTNRENFDSSIQPGNIFRVITDQKGIIWIATENNGVSQFDPDTKSSRNFSHENENTRSISSNQTTAVFEDSEGNIWVATTGGLDLYLPETREFFRYGTHNTNLSEDRIFSISQSREGIYWIGTRTELIAGIKTQFKKFDPVQNNLSNGSVNAFAETAEGSLWVGTDDGLNRLYPSENEFEWINESTNPGTSSPVIMSLFGDGNDLWIGTYDGGLNRLNIDTNEIQIFKHSPINTNSVGANGITSILKISTGEVLIGTYGGGLSVYIGDGKFENYKSRLNDPTSLSNNNVLALIEDSFGHIWVGTENGLNRFEPSSGEFQRFTVDGPNREGLSSKIVWSFLEDNQRNLWFGTEGEGLHLWRAADRQELIRNFSHFSENITLPSASVYGIQQDAAGWLWLSHNKGLTRLDPATLEVHQYGLQDGLQASEFNLGASFQSSNGAIYFGGIAGFNSIDSSNLKLQRSPPKVAISQVKVMNERREFESPYHALKSIELGYQDRMLSVEFFAADFTNPELLNYAYKLDGINPDWVISPDSRIASFTTLPPGEYTLHLAAASPDGTWNWDGLSMPIRVAPPPWRSPLAYSLYAFLVAAFIAYYFHRQRRKAMEAMEIQRELEARVRERTRDLVAARKEAEEATKAKSDFLATMSHEIRTPMHGIIGMTELLLHTNLSNQQQQFANAAHNSGESLLELINDILDFSKVEASKVEIESVDFDLTKLIEDICYLQGEPASKKGLSLNHVCDAGIPSLLTGDPTKLRQVVMNLVSNSIKFTHEGNVNVRVLAKFLKSSPTKTMVHICVEDDGIGMDDDTQNRVFEPFTQADTSTTRQYGGTGLGLSISRHYIALMGGDIHVQSAPNKGTRITISVPMPAPENQGEPVPQYEGLNASIYTDNVATFEMMEAIFAKIGIGAEHSSVERIGDLPSKEKRLVLFDYQPNLHSPFSFEEIDHSDATFRIVILPITIPLAPGEFEGWIKLTKPVMSSDIYDLLQSAEITGSARIDTNAPTFESDDKARRAILVAEDVGTNQRIIQEMLQLLGFDVDIAENGQVAVEKFASNSYALVFMDCQMPQMDGYEATKVIRAMEASSGSTNLTPIIALTAGSDQQDKERCAEAGMSDYITKPFTLSDIESHLTSHLAVIPSMKGPRFSNSAVLVESELGGESSFENGGESEVISMAAIESIRDVERQTGSPLLPTIFSGYKEQMAEKLEELEVHLHSGDNVELYRVAHAIKSMSANIGAEKVRLLSALIEQKGKGDQSVSPSDISISEVVIAYEEFIQAFTSIVSEHSS